MTGGNTAQRPVLKYTGSKGIDFFSVTREKSRGGVSE